MQLHRASGRAGRGLVLAGITALLWGVLPVALRRVLREVDPHTVTWFRFLIAAALLGALLASRGALPRVRSLGRGGCALLAVATLGLAGNYVGFAIGLERTGASNAQILTQLSPLLLALGGVAVFGERLRAAQSIGFAALLCGLGLFFAARRSGELADAPGDLAGSLVLVAAAASWAIYGLAQKQLLQRLPSQATLWLIYTGCALALAPGAQLSSLLALRGVPLALLMFCALNTAVAYGTFAAALEHQEASRVSAVLSLTPLCTLGFLAMGHRLFPEHVAAESLPPAALAAAVLAVVGSLAVALGGARPERSARPAGEIRAPPRTDGRA